MFLTFDPPSAGPPLESAPQPETRHVGAAGAAVGAGGRDPGQTAGAGGAAAGQRLSARLRKVLVHALAPGGLAPSCPAPVCLLSSLVDGTEAHEAGVIPQCPPLSECRSRALAPTGLLTSRPHVTCSSLTPAPWPLHRSVGTARPHAQAAREHPRVQPLSSHYGKDTGLTAA